jgi:hypothetical protein
MARNPPLNPGKICVALLFPENPAPRRVFHWTLILPTSATDFIMYHVAKSNLEDEWLYNNPRYTIAETPVLCTIAEIGVWCARLRPGLLTNLPQARSPQTMPKWI